MYIGLNERQGKTNDTSYIIICWANPFCLPTSRATYMRLNWLRGHSLTTLTRGGGQVVQKCRFFVNSYKVENVNVGG